MTTSGKMFCQYLGACVAALSLAAGLTACSDNVAAKPQPTVTTTVPGTPSPQVTVTTTAPATTTPSATPTATVTVMKPPTKPTPRPTTTKPTVRNQVTLEPMWETTDGDPGGLTWTEVGRRSSDKPKCNPVRDLIDFKVYGTKTVRGSLLSVSETVNNVVIRTNLKATAFIVNGEAAAQIPDVFWKREGTPPVYTFLLSKLVWEKTVGGEIYSVNACAVA
jgi:hypothetical protein